MSKMVKKKKRCIWDKQDILKSQPWRIDKYSAATLHSLEILFESTGWKFIFKLINKYFGKKKKKNQLLFDWI